MAMNFRLWLEAELGERKLERKLLRALGFSDPSALSLKIRAKEPEDFEKAFGGMGFDDDTKTELLNFVRGNQGSTINDLLKQMDEMDLPEKDEPGAPSRPAKIPSGQFIPKQPPQPQQPQMSPEMMPQPMG